MTSIIWTKISPRMKVVVKGHHYETAGGKLVTWGSRDARMAQTWLNNRVRQDKKRFAA